MQAFRASSRRGVMACVAMFLALVWQIAGAAAPQLPPVPGSGRLIIEFEAPSLAEWQVAQAGPSPRSITTRSRLTLASTAPRRHVDTLVQAQQQFAASLPALLPGARLASHLDGNGRQLALTYQLLFNGVAVDIGSTDTREAERLLRTQPGVKAVHRERLYRPLLHASLPLIGAPALWNAIGTRADAGSGIKLASMDGGIHHAAPMFDGSGWTYPPGYPLGDSANTNGKIIVSRAYFRPTDPPLAGDANSWPGEAGTSHGVHTASIAAGNIAAAQYADTDLGVFSGVAPAAWVMSYRVFYPSVSGESGFYTAEGLAALEDIVRDGADVVNNSWGAGPGSVGAPFDPLDQALLNAASAGILVVMSQGNAGPFAGTGDHPSDGYLNVAATTNSASYSAGRVTVTAPTPVPEALIERPAATSTFGAPFALGSRTSATVRTSTAVNPANVTGCSPWPAGTFAGRVAVIQRGGCEFGVKVLNAEQAGASHVIVYNNASGDILTNMAGGAVGAQVTIGSMFVSYSTGTALVAYHATHGDATTLEIDMRGYLVPGQADVVAAFSSRGPSAAGTLKPDLAAPGVSIMAQGYAPEATGEARHFGYNQVSGTSMAAPHVAGAAALLRQLRPTWSNAAIKSALMSTAKYLDIFTHDSKPAQPLDIGAGRVDLAAALDPGVILDPPSLSFGVLAADGSQQIDVVVHNISDSAETYAVDTVSTAAGFGALAPVPGLSVAPTSLVLAPGASAVLSVQFDAAAVGSGDTQGYVTLQGSAGHHAHLPAWARVNAPPPGADVLLWRNDMNFLLGQPSFLDWYTDALDLLGLSYQVFDDQMWWTDPQRVIPHPADLAAYRAVLYFSGNHYQPDGSFAQKSPPSRQDMDRLVEYANQGGTVIISGQDATQAMGQHFLTGSLFGIEHLRDGVAGPGMFPAAAVQAAPGAPPAFADLALDLNAPIWVTRMLEGETLVPPLSTTFRGALWSRLRPLNREFDYFIDVYTDGDQRSIVAAHIRAGAPGENGAMLFDIYPHALGMPLVVTGQQTWSGTLTLSPAQVQALADGALYLIIYTAEQPAGELRADLQITEAEHSGDGAGNQIWADEIAPAFTPLLVYPPLVAEGRDGVMALLRRDQPSLERPGISFRGRLAWLGFGLEGVGEGLIGRTSRAGLLQRLLDWGRADGQVTVEAAAADVDGQRSLQATFSGSVAGTSVTGWRWNFGDGTAIATGAGSSPTHRFRACGSFTVQAEASDSWGNVTLGSTSVSVDEDCATRNRVFANGFEGP